MLFRANVNKDARAHIELNRYTKAAPAVATGTRSAWAWVSIQSGGQIYKSSYRTASQLSESAKIARHF